MTINEWALYYFGTLCLSSYVLGLLIGIALF